ncbi:MAG: ABC transporter substrate-binding protein [Geminicoccaceae bacterium]|nr:ABC transporter substrate-binding protein [Geminicoccaceae bacterium]MDW8371673.1 ABC transporter substrate-binding protein [Geminicoccaceae bacterium]
MITRRRLALAAVVGALLGTDAAAAADKVTLRTNWLFYGSHAIFFLGIDKGFYDQEGIDLVVKQGNGSGNAVRLVANKDSTFAYASAVTMLNLAAQGAPVLAVATIDAQGTDAVLVDPDSGIKSFKDLEGKNVLTTAGAGVNTLFPVAARNAGADPAKIKLTNVAESALVSSYLQKLAPAMLGGIDDKPAEIKAAGGKPPLVFNYADYGVHQPGYAIVAHRDTVANNPDLVRRFVRATLRSVAAAKADPDAAIRALINWQASVEDQKQQAREVLDVTLSILKSKNAKDDRLGVNVPEDWAAALETLKTYKELKTDKPASAFYTNEFVPASLN